MGRRFLSADVGVLRHGAAAGPAVVIDIATGVRPAARLEWVIANIRLELAEVIIHLVERPPSGPSDTRVARIGQPGNAKKRRGVNRRPVSCCDVVVELRGFEPLTPCMPLPSMVLS